MESKRCRRRFISWARRKTVCRASKGSSSNQASSQLASRYSRKACCRHSVSLGAILKSDSAAEQGFPGSARLGCLGSAGRIGMVNGYPHFAEARWRWNRATSLERNPCGYGGPENEPFPNIRCSVQPVKGSDSQKIAQLAIVLGC